MRKLKEQIASLVPDHEATLIAFHIARNEYPKIKNISDLNIHAPTLSSEGVAEGLRLAKLRADGTPLQHILGYQYFLNHEYRVNDSTLIPRPETEILVSTAIHDLTKIFGTRPFRFAELGIGSGIISGEILSHFKNAKGIASEVSSDAIALARENLAIILGPSFEDRISIIEPPTSKSGFEVFESYPIFDVIFSNPPYVSSKDEIEYGVLKYEPKRALFPEVPGSSENPNYFYENFLSYTGQILRSTGLCYFEVPHERALAIAAMFKNAGFESVDLIPDLTGRNRVIRASFKKHG